MTADVNVTEKVAKRLFASPVSNQAARTAPEIMALCDEAAREALSVLADPEVQAGMARVLREHGAVTVRRGNTSRGGLIHNEHVCEGCGHGLPWHSWRDALADHAAAEAVEWLRGQAL